MIAIGIAAPALADMRTSYLNDWHDGDRSSSWSKTKGDTHVTFDRCTREFRAKIWLEKSFRSDTTKGEEWINCRSYADAVYARNVDAGRYHFDVSGMGFA